MGSGDPAVQIAPSIPSPGDSKASSHAHCRKNAPSGISEEDLHDIWSWNACVPESADVLVHDLIANTVWSQPNSTAICAWDGDFTYARLDALSTHLARYLRGFAPQNKIVPLCFSKSKWMAVAVLAVMKEGAASVLLDHDQPKERLQAAIAQLDTPIVLCSSDNFDLARELCNLEVLAVDEKVISLHQVEATAPLSIKSSDLLYMIFTSGTTGTPKGVKINHSNFSSAILHQKKFMYDQSSRILDFAFYSFDVAWSNLLFALTGGACLCVPSDHERKNDLSDCIYRYETTHLDLTPSLLRFLPPKSSEGIKVVNVGGEQLNSAEAKRWHDVAALRNLYGPSECTPTATFMSVDANYVEGNIGRGVGACTWIVDANDDLCPAGAMGELLLEGPIVGPGYLDHDRPAETFVENPIWLSRGAPGYKGRHGRLFRTRDIVRYQADGSLLFVGRKDYCVKINGQLAELGEIEKALRDCASNVTGAIADVVSPANYTRALLIGFLEIGKAPADQNGAQLAFLGLDDKLAIKLPQYMIPSLYVPMETLPTTIGGKIDRQKLRAFIQERTYKQLLAITSPSNGARQPDSDAEKQIQTLWASILQIDAESINRDDSFLQIGGDSLGAMNLVAEARKYGLQLTVADIMRNPRLNELAKLAPSATKETMCDEARPFSLLRNPLNVEVVIQQVSTLCSVSTAQVQDVFPCTPLQEGLFALTALRSGDYIAKHVFELRHDVDLDCFREAWEKVVAATPILRTRIVDIPELGLVQTVLDDKVDRQSHISSMKNGDLLENQKRQQSLPEFGFGKPLISFELTLKDDGRRFFNWTIHHSLFDGRSMSLILQTLQQGYSGQELQKAPNFGNFVGYLIRSDPVKAMGFWALQMQSLEAPQFPSLSRYDYTPKSTLCVTRQISDLRWPQLDVTASSCIRAAWAKVISGYTDCHDVVFGATTSGRQAPVAGVESMTGPTIATVPIRIMLLEHETTANYLRRVQAQAVEMTEYEQYGLQNIRKASSAADRACKFQSLLVVQLKETFEKEIANDIFQYAEVDETNEDDVKPSFYTYALTLICSPDETGLYLRIFFDPNVLSSVQINRISAHMEYVLQQLCASENSEKSFSNLGSISETDLRDIWGWNAITPESSQVLVHEKIGGIVRCRPDALAVDAWDGQWTYSELDTLSTSLAQYLVSIDNEYQRSFVPICFEKSKWTSVAMLAVVKTGSTAVALDPYQPVGRLRTIIQQVQPRMIVTSTSQNALARQLTDSRVVIANDAVLESSKITPCVLPNIDPSSMLYCVFTSGSTGVPKGVIVTHANFSTAILHQEECYGYGTGSRVYDFASYAFDAAWLNVLGTLCSGGCLCVPEDSERINNLAESLRHYRATHVDLTPSVARLLPLGDVEQLTTLIVSGEALQPADARRWAGLTDLKNVYGPCECTPTATAKVIRTERDITECSIGKGIGVSTWVVNGDSLVPIGGIGELLIEGPLVGLGYLNAPEDTAKAFIEDPAWLITGVADHPGRRGRLYRTGDLVRYNDEGNLLFVGRKDLRAKIGGQLVELSDIEHHIQRHDLVRQCACLIPQQGVHAKRLVCVFSINGISSNAVSGDAMQPLATSSGVPINHYVDTLRQMLDSSLPQYMVPAIWLAMNDIPLNAAGKLDRRRLDAWISSMSVEALDDEVDEEPVPARSATSYDIESILLDACSSVLDVPLHRLQCQRSFISNGGDSIAAMRLIPRLRAANIVISVADLLRHQSLAKLADDLVVSEIERINEPEGLEETFPLSPIQRWFFQNLGSARARRSDCHFNQSSYLRVQKRLCPSKLLSALTKVVNHHPMLRARFVESEGVWAQRVQAPSANSFIFYLSQAEDLADVARLVQECHRRLDIERAPVFLTVLSELPDGRQFLCMIAHHLVIDIVSWQVILDDLDTVLRDGQLKKGISFRAWNQLQIERVATLPVTDTMGCLSNLTCNSDLAFWAFSESTSNSRSDHQSRVIAIDSETSQRLLGDANRMLETEPIDLLLCGVFAAFFRAFPERQSTTVWNEGHGREPWPSYIDLTQTVGWFTTLSPITIESGKANDLQTLVRTVQDVRRRLTSNGWAYFASRYLSLQSDREESLKDSTVEIVFNYHGLLREQEPQDSYFESIALDGVDDEGPDTPTMHLFGFEISVEEGEIKFEMNWNRHICHQDRILKWIEGLSSSMSLLSASLNSAPIPAKGFALGTNDMEVDRRRGSQQVLLPHIEAINSSNIIEVLRCSPTATGMLLSQDMQPQLYRIKEVYEISAPDGDMRSATALAAAWQDVVAHQPALRSVMTSAADESAAFYQVVLGSSQGEILHKLCSDCEAAKRELQALPALDCRRLKPPHRLTLCRLDRDPSKIVCQIEISHVLTDSISVNLLMENWMAACGAALPPLDLLKTCREAAQYFDAHATATLTYWRQKLAGMQPCIFPQLSHSSQGKDIQGEAYTVTLELPRDTVQALREISQALSKTLVAIFQAAWAQTMASYCGTDAICFSYLTSGRDLPISNLDKCMGAFANVMICRVENVSQTSSLALIEGVSTQMSQDIAFQHCYLAAVQHDLGIPSGQALFNSSLNCQKMYGGFQHDSDDHTGLLFDNITGEDPTEYDVAARVGFSDSQAELGLDSRASFMSQQQAQRVLSLFLLHLTAFTRDSELLSQHEA